MDTQILVANRERLIAWQRRQWYRDATGVRLHLGCGKVRLPGYINCDLYGGPDKVMDLRRLEYPDNSVAEIVCQHALEHIPHFQAEATLREWYRALRPGGTLEVGVPDVALCARAFLEASEAERWSKYVYTLVGWQIDDQASPGPDVPTHPGQFHLAAFTLGHLVRMMERVGFRIIECYSYDGYGTASAFVFAEKPEPLSKTPSVLEADCAIGTFTHRTTYLPALHASARRFLPHVQFVTRIHDGPINVGMTLLRQDFIETGKRYWIFLDDDIQFLNSEIIHNAIARMIAGHYGAMSVYSTFRPEVITEPYDASGLATRETKWATGYFILVDSQRVGHVEPDLGLPDANTAVDTSYSVAIRAAGHRIGISADYVYHVKKNVWINAAVIEPTNKYLMGRWGQFYFDIAQYDGNVIEWGEKGNV